MKCFCLVSGFDWKHPESLSGVAAGVCVFVFARHWLWSWVPSLTDTSWVISSFDICSCSQQYGGCFWMCSWCQVTRQRIVPGLEPSGTHMQASQTKNATQGETIHTFSGQAGGTDKLCKGECCNRVLCSPVRQSHYNIMAMVLGVDMIIWYDKVLYKSTVVVLYFLLMQCTSYTTVGEVNCGFIRIQYSVTLSLKKTQYTSRWVIYLAIIDQKCLTYVYIFLIKSFPCTSSLCTFMNDWERLMPVQRNRRILCLSSSCPCLINDRDCAVTATKRRVWSRAVQLIKFKFQLWILDSSDYQNKIIKTIIVLLHLILQLCSLSVLCYKFNAPHSNPFYLFLCWLILKFKQIHC